MKHFLGAMLVSVLTVAVMAPNPARSAVIINFEETGGSVTMNLSGSLDIAGTSFSFSTPFFTTFFSPTSSFGPNASILVTGNNVADIYFGLSGPSVVGSATGSFFPANPSSTSFWLMPTFNEIGVPAGYASGDPLNATLTFTGQSFASMGLTAGDQFVWTLPNDTITMNIVAASAPAGLPLALAAFGAVALIRRRRRSV